MRGLLLALALSLLSAPACALSTTWLCAPTLRLSCHPQSGCAENLPAISEVALNLTEGDIAFCIGETCYEGVVEFEREGAPDWRSLGTAIVEELPLKRSYSGRLWFASFEVNDRRFVLSGLSHLGQDTTWFDCWPKG